MSMEGEGPPPCTHHSRPVGSMVGTPDLTPCTQAQLQCRRPWGGVGGATKEEGAGEPAVLPPSSLSTRNYKTVGR